MNKTKLAIFGSTGAATAAVAVGSTSYAITKTLVDIALEHEPPAVLTSIKSMITRSNRTNDFLTEMKRTEDILLSKDTEEVSIEAYDGTILKGHILHCNHPQRIIIAFHGWRARWSRDFGMISDFWNEDGATVIYVEQRGQNGSSFAHMGFGAIERFDCVSWAKYACDRFADTLPIYLAGISMGATTVLMSANLELPERVHGIMADCGFTSADNIWRHVVHNNLHLPYNLRGKIADRMCLKKTGYGADEINTLRVLKEARVPVLFIHGLDDNFVPVDMTINNYKACASRKKMYLVSGADHGMSYYCDRNGYESIMREFWKDFD